ncbi:odorant receptor 2a-like [Anticarsia gemmatalis]|uniref:odorant receptor 2a-like n=1 Tax=Anticarsia gemmatalis TaxID=129554 RepID=UPI003F75C4D2
MPSDQSTTLFNIHYKVWNVFGIWGGRKPSKCYKFYSVLYLLVTFFFYNALLTLNLIYTPRKIELILREVIFYFTEITVAAKVFTILLLRSKIIEALNLIDCDEFVGDFGNKDGILNKVHKNYTFGWRFYALSSNIAYSSQVFVPILLDLIRKTESELPICKYYFLSDEDRRSYYIYWFIYQSFGMYGHMMYNVTIDSFIAGLLLISIAQMRLLNTKLSNFKLSVEETKLSKDLQDKISITRLNNFLKHYDVILKYNKVIQEILSVTTFFQFSVASIIICVVMCGLLLPSSTETFIFLVMYLFTMTMQIFVPGLLGTHLTYESQELVFAAYNSEWIPRSESFKRSLRLFMERAKTPIMITGLNMFPLSLLTFTSIMKTAYSFFTLIRNFQEQ